VRQVVKPGSWVPQTEREMGVEGGSAAILEKVVETWNEGRLARRDNYLRVGRMLREFLLERLREGDQLSERDRLSRSLRRDAAVREAAERLDVTPEKVRGLIRTAAVVELLCLDGVLGKVAYSTLEIFGVCVERPWAGLVIQNGSQASEGQVPLSKTEEWQVKPAALGWSASLFRRVVVEDMRRADVEREVYSRIPQGRRGRRRLPEKGGPRTGTGDAERGGGRDESSPQHSSKYRPDPAVLGYSRPDDLRADQRERADLFGVARLAPPRDLAELIEKAVLQSRDPEAARREIVERLGRLRVPLTF